MSASFCIIVNVNNHSLHDLSEPHVRRNYEQYCVTGDYKCFDPNWSAEGFLASNSAILQLFFRRNPGQRSRSLRQHGLRGFLSSNLTLSR